MSAQVSVAVAAVPLHTTDAGTAMGYFRNAYSTTLRFSGLRDGPVYTHSRLDAGALALDEVRVPAGMNATVDPLQTLVVTRLAAGRFQRVCGGFDEAFLPGDVFIDADPGLPATLRMVDIRVQTMMLDLAVLAQVGATAPARVPGPIRFTGYRAVSYDAAANWTRIIDFLRELLTNREAATQPLILGNAARLAASAALATFPNTALHAPTAQDRHDATAATVRRAIAFIEQNPDADIGVARIAAAANVSIRTLQLAFRRHRNTTPMAFLRGVRLQHVHDELRAANPTRGATVTDIAMRWGFYNHSRFARLYRETFGVTPRLTLVGR